MEAYFARVTPNFPETAQTTSPASSSTSPSIESKPAQLLQPWDHSLIEADDDEEDLVQSFKGKLNMEHTHFLGKSSSLIFVKTAAKALKEEYDEPTNLFGDASPDHLQAKLNDRRSEARKAMSVSPATVSAIDLIITWRMVQILIKTDPPHPREAFPPPALMTELIENYFLHFNALFPLLHRPTFENGIRTGLHLTDQAFGSTVLLVCANGARFSDDTTVLPPGVQSWHWAGWHWFQHVNEVRRVVHLQPPGYYDLQVYNVRDISVSGDFILTR